MKGPLVLLLRKLQDIEDTLWRPILEEHSVQEKNALSAVMDKGEESSQEDYGDQDEDLGEGQDGPEGNEDGRQGGAGV
jgi:hypothetical protein